MEARVAGRARGARGRGSRGLSALALAFSTALTQERTRGHTTPTTLVFLRLFSFLFV